MKITIFSLIPKTVTRSFSASFLILASIILVSCASGKKEESTNDSGNAASLESTFTTDDNFRKQITAFYQAYLGVKDALVASDSIAAATAIKSLRPAFNGLQPLALSEGAKAEWDSRSVALESAITAMEQNPGLDGQRETFSNMSDESYRLVKAFGLSGTDTYYAYCPMALQDKGAYWLSHEKEIRNPYFGASMLNCGAVRELRH